MVRLALKLESRFEMSEKDVSWYCFSQKGQNGDLQSKLHFWEKGKQFCTVTENTVMFLPFESITLLITFYMCRHFQNSLCCINTCPDPRLKVNSHLSQVYHPIWATVRNHIIWSCQIEKMKTALKNQPFQTFLQFFVQKIAVRQVYRP